MHTVDTCITTTQKYDLINYWKVFQIRIPLSKKISYWIFTYQVIPAVHISSSEDLSWKSCSAELKISWQMVDDLQIMITGNSNHGWVQWPFYNWSGKIWIMSHGSIPLTNSQWAVIGSKIEICNRMRSWFHFHKSRCKSIKNAHLSGRKAIWLWCWNPNFKWPTMLS